MDGRARARACLVSFLVQLTSVVVAVSASAEAEGAASIAAENYPNKGGFWIGVFAFNVTANCLADLKQETVFDAFTTGTFSIVTSDLGFEGMRGSLTWKLACVLGDVCVTVFGSVAQ